MRAQPADQPRRRLWLPGLGRRSVRLRLTGLYSALFFASAVVLVAIVGGVTSARTSQAVRPAPNHAPAGGTSAAAASAGGQAGRLIRHLEALLAQQSQQTHTALSQGLILASVIAIVAMTIVSIVLGWILAARALRPVREMTATAQRISADSLDERLAVPGPQDELKELGDTIDGLLERLESAFSAQRRFVANASHELRTPLATMRASIDVALGKPDPAPPQTVALGARLRTELDRIDTLLEALLALARAQHRDLPDRTELPLDYVVRAALADQQAAISAKNLTVRDSGGPGGAWVTGSQALLSRMVENVIDNAVCHNEPGGWIRIAAHADGEFATLEVENGGQLIDQRMATDLAQPFRRAGADRTGSDNGSGLGLSIVAAIAQAHGGRLELRAREGGGLLVRIELPAAAPVGASVPAGSSA